MKQIIQEMGELPGTSSKKEVDVWECGSNPRN
jgi:hypothetical protein